MDSMQLWQDPYLPPAVDRDAPAMIGTVPVYDVMGYPDKDRGDFRPGFSPW